jgi:SAM-dependent methyltransferase
VDSLEKYRQLWQDSRKRRADFHLLWPDRPFRENFSILIAGCGSSQAAKHALRWPRAQLTAIDISTTSLRYTEELKRKHNLTNLEIHQLAIEDADQLQTNFDQIVCTGVLHHLKDPDAGLAALHNLLRPDGVMHLMVYASYGRAGIYMLQEFCRTVGIRATDENISELVDALRALPHGHPLEMLLQGAPDFKQPAALADALLHPQDRAYTVPQLYKFLRQGKMKFGRWIKQAPYSAHCGVLAQIPQSHRLEQLNQSEQFAAAELFRGTMVRHSFTAYRDDAPIGSGEISFAGDAWLQYVPIRLPETICVQERLPAGVAGVLINQGHTYTDLLMPIGSIEKRLLDAVDGVRSIEQIVGLATAFVREDQLLDLTRTFFERLWWHDQVVLDRSGDRTTR